MKCRKVQKKLSAYHDGELGIEARDRVKAHLMGCSECRKQLEAFSHIWEALGELPDTQPGPSFHLGVRQRISRLNDRRFIPRLRHVSPLLPRRLAMAALALVGVVIGAYAGNFLAGEGWVSRKGPQPVFSQLDVTLASVRAFDPMPPGTLAKGYVRMASYPGSARE